MDVQGQLERFIDKYSPEVAADARRALAFLAKRLPTASRLVYDNYNALVVGFGTSEKVGDIILSIALYPRWVTLFFLRGVDLPDPDGLLGGSGSQVRGVRLQPISRLETPEVGTLIDAAVARASPLPAGGEGPLIIKSISAKQRPRRPTS
ncbi:MAG: hypothetical protein QOK41_1599 [Sphingomonadales bacterium]|nr:hypothetical protein [Sphingomonadales bacterium]